MKKLILSLAALTLTLGANAQNVNIPDANFKAFLVGESQINTNSDTEIQVAEAAAFGGTMICESLGITDMTGISAFTNLTGLRCAGNAIATLDLSANINLWGTLRCDNNAITSMILPANNNINEIYCGNNLMTGIDLSTTPNLTLFHAVNNDFTSLDVSNNTALVHLNFGGSPLTSIDLTGLNNLQILAPFESGLTSLDISMCPSIYNIYGPNMSSLTELNMANGNNMSFGPNDLDITNAPNLTCVTVDNVSFSNQVWPPFFDAGVTFSVDCNSAVPLATSVTIGGPSSVAVGSDIQMSAAVMPANASQNVLWQVQNGTGQATIDQNTGLLTGVAVGTVDVGAMATDGSNEYGTMTVNVTQVAGINEVDMINMIIYPNPAQNELTIKTDESIQTIQIFNMSGRLIQTETTTSFSVAQLVPGMYVLNVMTDNGVKKHRFIKE